MRSISAIILCSCLFCFSAPKSLVAAEVQISVDGDEADFPNGFLFVRVYASQAVADCQPVEAGLLQMDSGPVSCDVQGSTPGNRRIALANAIVSALNLDEFDST